MTELDYNLSRLITGDSEDSLGSHLESTFFEQEARLTWDDEPSDIQFKDLSKVPRNYEYYYVLENYRFVEKVRLEPIGCNIQGHSVPSISSLSSILESINDSAILNEGRRHVTRKKPALVFPFTEEEQVIESVLMNFINTADVLFAKRLKKNDFDIRRLCLSNDENYVYSILQPNDLQELAAASSLIEQHMPALMRQDLKDKAIYALCPFCQNNPTYILFRQGSNTKYVNHLKLRHGIVKHEQVEPLNPMLTLRDMKQRDAEGRYTGRKLMCYLICPYPSCEGKHYSLSATINYGTCLSERVEQVDADAMMLNYNKHFFAKHFVQRTTTDSQAETTISGEDRVEPAVLPPNI